ncbi:MAG: hypothetical protein K6D02_01830 [Lachnospiraceae bacterium]|nr:hypothetical protein [Lachnospiraceae bacterium]
MSKRPAINYNLPLKEIDLTPIMSGAPLPLKGEEDLVQIVGKKYEDGSMNLLSFQTLNGVSNKTVEYIKSLMPTAFFEKDDKEFVNILGQRAMIYYQLKAKVAKMVSQQHKYIKDTASKIAKSPKHKKLKRCIHDLANDGYLKDNPEITQIPFLEDRYKKFKADMNAIMDSNIALMKCADKEDFDKHIRLCSAAYNLMEEYFSSTEKTLKKLRKEIGKMEKHINMEK